MTSSSEILKRNRLNGGSLVGYFPLGYPTIEHSVEAAVAMCESGVDVLEIGIPYSDPVMDGLVIQEATEIALNAGFKLRDAFEAISEITSRVSAPVLVMTYWNPVLQYGVKEFAHDLKSSGAVGAITPDLIPDEAGDWIAVTDELELDRVFLATPSSRQARIKVAAESSRGFVYAVSTMGITGARDNLDANARLVVSRVKEVSDVTTAVGIGVSTAEQVREINTYADGAIVGSALVRAYQSGGLEDLRIEVTELAKGKQRA